MASLDPRQGNLDRQRAAALDLPELQAMVLPAKLVEEKGKRMPALDFGDLRSKPSWMRGLPARRLSRGWEM